MNNIKLIIIGMALVTFIPRLIPFYMISGKELPSKLKQFLNYIPYAALGALIFPGVLTSIPNSQIASIAGISFAFAYGWFKGGIVIPVIGSIALVYGILLLS